MRAMRNQITSNLQWQFSVSITSLHFFRFSLKTVFKHRITAGHFVLPILTACKRWRCPFIVQTDRYFVPYKTTKIEEDKLGETHFPAKSFKLVSSIYIH